jgi:hypothetical protein
MANKEDITYPIRIDSELWEKFKLTIPRNITINDFIVELIRNEVKK